MEAVTRCDRRSNDNILENDNIVESRIANWHRSRFRTTKSCPSYFVIWITYALRYFVILNQNVH